jgi:hypothetical protein
MPRERVLLGTRPLLVEDLRDVVAGALPRARLRAVQGGEAAQVLVDGIVVLTVVRPREVATPAEAARLLPGRRIPDDHALWWIDVVIAPGSASDVVDPLLDALAAAVR